MNMDKYATLLNDMIRKDFNRDKSTWTIDYEQAFEELKEGIMNAMVLYFIIRKILNHSIHNGFL